MRRSILKMKRLLGPFLEVGFWVVQRHELHQTISIELPLELPFRNMRQLGNKKDRLGNLSMTWILRVGATGFEPAT